MYAPFFLFACSFVLFFYSFNFFFILQDPFTRPSAADILAVPIVALPFFFTALHEKEGEVRKQAAEIEKLRKEREAAMKTEREGAVMVEKQKGEREAAMKKEKENAVEIAELRKEKEEWMKGRKDGACIFTYALLFVYLFVCVCFLWFVCLFVSFVYFFIQLLNSFYSIHVLIQYIIL
jgi:ABC-type multidrug transport system fused ATPase/permease subunit